MSETLKLGLGTQTVPMLGIVGARCRCGRSLIWRAGDSDDLAIANYAECRCGMSYIAGQAVVKVEGIERRES